MAAASCAMLLAALPAGAQTYPDQPVTILVGVNPGGGTDTIARRLAKALQDKWGKPVLVENRAGADGTIASSLVKARRPDGYTLLLTNNGFTLSPMNMKVEYDPIKDFSPVTQIGQTPLVLAANPSLNASDGKSLIKALKAKPGEYSAGASGSANSTFNAMEQLRARAEVDITTIPYKGAAAMVTALVAGEVQLGFSNLIGIYPFLESNGGGLKPIAVTSSKRASKIPDVPTMEEALGLDKFEIWNAWYGLLAPRGVDPAILSKIQTDVLDVMHSPELQKAFEAEGLDVIGSTPDEFKAVLENHVKLYAQVFQPK